MVDLGCGLGRTSFIQSLMGSGNNDRLAALVSDGNLTSCLSLHPWRYVTEIDLRA